MNTRRDRASKRASASERSTARGRLSIRALAAIVEQVEDLVCVCDLDGKIEYVNPAFERCSGYSSTELIGRTPALLKSGLHDAAFYQSMWETLAKGEPFSAVFVNRGKSGELFHEAKTISAIRDARGRVIRYLSTGRCVTEQMRAETRLQRLSRARSIVARCAHALIHAQGEEVLDEICRIVLEQGGHRSAWIGFAEDDEQRSVRPVASAGLALREAQDLRLTWADTPRGRGAVGVALRTRRPKVIDDYMVQAESAAWRDFAATHGFRSGVALPLRVDDTCTGVLMINAPDARRFDAEEVGLLEELADDIAFGIRTLRLQRQRDQVERALHVSEHRFRAVVEQAAIGVVQIALDGRLLDVNQKACDILGYSRDELLRSTHCDIAHPDDADGDRSLHDRAIAGECSTYDVDRRYVRRDRSTVWARVMGSLILDQAGRPAYFLTVLQDVTDRKRTEHEVRLNAVRLREAQRVARLGSWEFEPQGSGRVWSEEVFRILEIDPARASPSREAFLAAVHPEDRDAVIMAYAESVRSRTPYEITHRLLLAGGRVKHVLERGETIYDGEGRPVLSRGTIQDVSERLLAQEETSRSAARMRVLAERLIEVQEEERRAISRELHDEIGQALTAAKIHLQAMLRSCAGCEIGFSMANLEEAAHAVARTLEQVRGMSLDLRPIQLEEFGLAVALRSLLTRQSAAAGWTVHYEPDYRRESVATALELVCFRVVQEALTNAMRYAAASEVWVQLRQSDLTLRLSVRDNGVGFDLLAVQSVRREIGLGLLGMEERVKSAGGVLEIRTAPGQGTEIQATFTLKVKPAGDTAAGAGTRG